MPNHPDEYLEEAREVMRRATNNEEFERGRRALVDAQLRAAIAHVTAQPTAAPTSFWARLASRLGLLRECWLDARSRTA